ncbi:MULTISPECIES: hypothetical protein [unclassified Streptomyces]|uniref:hypothetical protein n=1 Tax=unclassified Streptomyces TaxID=2593676 RepID=UPI002DD7ED99|nr:hypothetical protein [Streptomyces sp. NBC_01788]WSB24545.1 hypothetical protein OIE49_00530 [Streptomyces sp. NBC_01788]
MNILSVLSWAASEQPADRRADGGGQRLTHSGHGAMVTVLVVIEEVLDGGWGVAGKVLTAAMLNGDG